MCWHVLCLCVGRWWCVLIVVGASVVSGQPKDMTILLYSYPLALFTLAISTL